MESPKKQERREALRPWRIIESFSSARDASRGSEDLLVVGHDCVAVFDGVSTADKSLRIAGLTPGQFAVRLGAQVLREEGITPGNIVQSLSKRLRESLEGQPRVGTPSFVFAAFFPTDNMIVRVGDCSYLIDGEGYNPGIPVDRVRAVLRSRMIGKRLRAGADPAGLAKEDPFKPRSAALTPWQEHFSNSIADLSLAYGVINGNDVPIELIEQVPVPPNTKQVILASDGYPPQALSSSLRETEEKLHRLQERDPLALSEGGPGTRPLKPAVAGQTATDDRTYVRIER